MREVANNYQQIVTVEDGTIVGGLGSAVAEWLSENDKPCRLTRLGVRDEFIDQGTVKQQQQLCGIDEQSLYERLKQLMTSNP